ncbi:MAG: hypothetical protein EXS13_02450 [Planctomycetes bacterium]|nr:hypothetical protein [Planctomycetota bacterium]
MKTPSSAQPPRLGALWLIVFLASATVPALLSWTGRSQCEELRLRKEQLAALFNAGNGDRRPSLPVSIEIGATTAALARTRPLDRLRLDPAIVFSPAQIELYRDQGAIEGDFDRVLSPPDGVTARATRDAVVVEWAPPDRFAELTSRLVSQPLLRLGFRVYRWRENEGGEPKLLTTLVAREMAYQDHDLPLGRERFTYCVATVIEGTIGDLPTLIESKRSSVISVETIENFSLEVMDAQAAAIRVLLHAYVDGQTIDRVLDVAVGDPIAAVAAADLPEALARRLDTGLILTALKTLEANESQTHERAEFLPDGRRKLDPTSGLPSFQTESVTVPIRTLEWTCRERSGATRTFTSPAPN